MQRSGAGHGVEASSLHDLQEQLVCFGLEVCRSRTGLWIPGQRLLGAVSTAGQMALGFDLHTVFLATPTRQNTCSEKSQIMPGFIQFGLGGVSSSLLFNHRCSYM